MATRSVSTAAAAVAAPACHALPAARLVEGLLAQANAALSAAAELVSAVPGAVSVDHRLAILDHQRQAQDLFIAIFQANWSAESQWKAPRP